MLEQTIKYVDVHVDGRGFLGKATNCELPRLAVRTEDIRAGLDAPEQVDMGIEPLTCTLVCRGIDGDLAEQWGVTTGDPTPLVIYGAQTDSDGNVQQIRADMRGRVKELNPGRLATGQVAEVRWMVSIQYYKLQIDNKERILVDIPNFIRRVNGVDQLAEIRRALGRGA